MSGKFIHHNLRLVSPSFDSLLTELVITLEHLRKPQIQGTTPSHLFYQLKDIFHLLESIGSARIEGNNTTIAEYLENKIEAANPAPQESYLEIQNIERAMDYIEGYIQADYPVNETLLKEIHQIIVDGLNKEGDKNAGEYRLHDVRIASSNHTPPRAELVPAYMAELFDFLKQEDAPRFDLIKVALAHHRFVWIHPFGNGNGRTVRLFTYALLLKYGYGLNVAGRIVNPTAVFCADRERYYDMLALADGGQDADLLKWCEYVLGGLKQEIEKLDKLSSYQYVTEAILLPALKISLARKVITPSEYKILSLACGKPEIQNADIQHLFPNKSKAFISIEISKLREKGMLAPTEEGKRKYNIRFDNNYLLRGIMKALDDEGFLPIKND